MFLCVTSTQNYEVATPMLHTSSVEKLFWTQNTWGVPKVCPAITALFQWLLQQESIPCLTIKSHSLKGQHFPVFQAFNVLIAAPM